jgi:hypothetical protein
MTSNQRHEVEKLLNQAGAVAFLMGAVTIEDSAQVQNELGNAGWLLKDLLDQVLVVVLAAERENAA